MDINADSISQNITKYRLKARINQKQLAKITGLHVNYVSDLENNKGILPSMDSLDKIAEALNITIDQILFENLNTYNSNNFDDEVKFINKEINFMNKDKLKFLLDFLTVYEKNKLLNLDH